MREILKSGVTGILVSHSVPQVRSMCNKILWLDHGHQIGFSGQVQEYCDAYEEFLITKKLPHTTNEIRVLAENFHIRKKREQDLANRTETQRLEDLLNKGDSDAALQAAVSIIKKKRPDLLK